MRLVRERGTTPTVGAAICCFVLILLIQFFLNLALPPPQFSLFSDLALRVVISLVVVIALPAILMTLFLTSGWKRTLLLQRPRALKSIPVAVLLAIVLHPVVHSLQYVVQALYPVSDAVTTYAKFLAGLFDNAPYSWLPFVLIAVLPALCEELAFRGFILSGLRHLGHKWWAIVLSAVFFGVAHGLLQQSIMASLLGVVLGFLAVQTGSLIPCILFHLTHNGVTLWSAQFDFSAQTFARYPVLTLFVQPLRDGQEGFVYAWPTILAGAVIAALLLGWLNRRSYQKTSEEELLEALSHQSLRSLTEDA
jgi:sodium transport system permease protein